MLKHALLIINPASGNHDNKIDLIDNITKNTSGYKVTQWNTTGENDAYKIGHLLDTENHDIVMVAGGDGTISLVASQMLGSDTPLLPIPLGSANGLCACLGIQNLDDSINALKIGNTIQMDILSVNETICLHLCDFGFNAALVKKFEESEERGMISYFKSSLTQAFENNKFSFGLDINGETVLVDAKMLVIANGDRYGTGVKINPLGKLNDRKFEVVVLNPDSIQDWTALTLAFLKEDLSGLDFVEVFQTKRVHITNLKDAVCHVDGEVIDDQKTVLIELMDKSVNFFSNV
ncbi:diacylglycerol/lipid kinase family protein [Belliella kenyensis]|uniref:Diacylglycerol/lipid kinase family protein n=1 Tax=Belliella kenyensis TaxID=1472724 RepID=A0ABV8ENH0_9BACT|nr:diacylglycerol kinase family protein [Belliella kenyensis]MCH7402009.1 diacylglycerol kinase [Belliella kenyensis]MDN3605173.1 diacylglycerol kinase family protein [Belliella kenyensis]